MNFIEEVLSLKAHSLKKLYSGITIALIMDLCDKLCSTVSKPQRTSCVGAGA